MQQEKQTTQKTVEQIVIEGIGLNRMISAHYNGTQMRLAPHQLLTRHGEFFITALNVDKNWRSEEDWRLGQFKVAGLSNVALIDETFKPIPSYDNSLPHNHDELVFSVLPAGETPS